MLLPTNHRDYPYERIAQKAHLIINTRHVFKDVASPRDDQQALIMCGIAGIVLNPNKTLSDMPDRLQAMASAMLHRGPDDEGAFVSSDGRVGLTSRRLGIQDLSPAGHMPMGNGDGRLQIVYNGEILRRFPERRAGFEWCRRLDARFHIWPNSYLLNDIRRARVL